ncbi:hypothetical protein GIB67_007873 [Kingdonia uniflora]|uniref:Uncharacterized protein n=1 Tax=Kingdonia uniflora TaxID=39325 RepID=A0A7J7PAX9_9MAGN|nr:hypothetical protein GIB67_007873 [Kingdonia uniflora]
MASSAASQPLVTIQPLEGDMTTDGSNTIPLPDVLKASIHRLFWFLQLLEERKGTNVLQYIQAISGILGQMRSALTKLGIPGEFFILISGDETFPKIPQAKGAISAMRGQPFFIRLYKLFLTYGGLFRLTFGPKRFINRSKPNIRKEQQLNLTRWAVLLAGSLLKNNKVAHEALMSLRHICAC